MTNIIKNDCQGEDITPADMRCSTGMSCHSVHRLEDGQLLIVGKRAPIRIDDRYPPSLESVEICASMGPEEDAIVISPALLDGFVSQAVKDLVQATASHPEARGGQPGSDELRICAPIGTPGPQCSVCARCVAETREAENWFLRERIKELETNLTWMVYEISHLSPREDRDGVDVYRPIIACSKVDEVRALFKASPQTTGDGTATAAQKPVVEIAEPAWKTDPSRHRPEKRAGEWFCAKCGIHEDLFHFGVCKTSGDRTETAATNPAVEPNLNGPAQENAL